MAWICLPEEIFAHFEKNFYQLALICGMQSKSRLSYENYLKLYCSLFERWNVCETTKHMAKASIDHVIQIWMLEFFKIDADVSQIGPGYVVLRLKTFFGDMIILQTVTPLEPLRQKLSHYFYASRWLGFFMKFSIFGETVNVCRDTMVWDYKTFLKNPLLPKEEKQIKLYRNWFSQFYSENSLSFQNAQSNLNWWMIFVVEKEISIVEREFSSNF